MILRMAALCDAATIREGLLNVLGAGVTKCTLSLPGPLPVSLALLMEFDPKELVLNDQHRLTIRLLGPEADQLMEQTALWTITDIPVDQTVLTLPLVADLRIVGVAAAGSHRIVIAVDDQQLADLPFLVAHDPSGDPAVTTSDGDPAVTASDPAH